MVIRKEDVKRYENMKEDVKRRFGVHRIIAK